MNARTLADALGSTAARQLCSELRGRGLEIERDPSEWEARGFTDAYLLAVIVEQSSGDHRQPSRCVAKVFPRGAGAAETTAHHEALQVSPDQFVKQHLVGIAFERVRCPDGTMVVGYEIADDGSLSCRQLAELTGQALVDACAAVRAGVLEEWTGLQYRKVINESWPELLRRELRGERSLLAWGDDLGLRDDSVQWIHLPPDGVLPNPLRYLRGEVRANRRLAYLTGRSHGDLHAGNVLIPLGPDHLPRPAEFRLIDLAGFEKDAPLSRDPATLLLSVLSRRISPGTEGALPTDQQDALLRYLVSDDATGLDMVPPVLVRLVDALRSPGKAPFVGAAWSASWAEQFRVSLLAAALRHCTYRSVGPIGRWWCLRLAARLALRLASEPARTHADLELSPAIFDDDSPASPPDLTFINHRKDYTRLRTSLLAGRSRVIKVHGRPGVGKSRLVGTVLAALAPATRGRGRALPVVCHDASPAAGISVQTLVEDIEGGAAVTSVRRGGSWLVRLEKALRSREQARLIIVIDSAQWLVRSESGELADLELDHALELLATDPSHRVTVVFVSPDAPVSWPGHRWSTGDAVVTVGGLAVDHFVAYLRQLGSGDPLELVHLPRPVLGALRDQLDGNPRLAELFHAIIALNTEARGAPEVADDVLTWDRPDLPGQLVRELIKHLPGHSRSVLAALAAYATPVTARQVSALVSPAMLEPAVRTTLLQLVNWRLVRSGDDRFYLPASDTELMLTGLSERDGDDSGTPTGRRESLLVRAAAELSNDRTPAEQLRGPADLGAHFAELHAWLRAGQFTAAYGLVERMDPRLRKWNRADLLLEQREQIRRHLASDRDELGNLNALGDIYAAQSRFDLADAAHTDALEYATRLDETLAHRRIIANMATTALRRNETTRADELFRQALAAAEHAADAADQRQALEGLAQCHRRWGEYESALACARAALTLARSAGSPRQVTLQLRLARWYAELGQSDKAEPLIREADMLTRKDEFEWLRPACLDSYADLLLDDDHLHAPEVDNLDKAIDMARKAVEGALAHQDPVTLVQARTTLCVTYLKLNKINEAGREITRAAHYRQPQPSMLVLALSALVARRRREARQAGALFNQLHDQACQRRQRDGRDFAALDFEGLALCGRHVDGSDSLDTAITLFRDARRQTPATPGLRSRLLFLLEQLQYDRPGRLQPVIAAVRSAPSRPWRPAEERHLQD